MDAVRFFQVIYLSKDVGAAVWTLKLSSPNNGFCARSAFPVAKFPPCMRNRFLRRLFRLWQGWRSL